jgi:dipeptidyl aminopeptidase/acylaminoacyl peptidase
MVKIAPFGSWSSPITADLVASSSIRIGDLQLHGSKLYWSEMRPSEDGRYVVMEFSDKGIKNITPNDFNIRTIVHEYGGRAYTIVDDTLYFSNYKDQITYRHKQGELPVKLSRYKDHRHADYFGDKKKNLLVCIREDHSVENLEAVNTIVSFNLDDGSSRTLVEGNDFYSNPRLSPESSLMAFMTWNHPNMPWDGCELWIAEVEKDGSIGQMRHVSGGLFESVVQPEWSPMGNLYFISDKNGWWNLYRLQDGKVEIVYPMEAEFGGPHWVFGLSYYGFESEGKLIAIYNKDGFKHLARINTNEKTLEEIKTPYTDLSYLQVDQGYAFFIGGNYKTAQEVVKINLESNETQVLKKSDSVVIDDSYLSYPRPIKYPTEKGLIAHAIYYPPVNKDYNPPRDELPPLIVKVHGGPTSATNTTLNWGTQYWTSRGFGLVDVNYGGSTGYGREYMLRLNDNWGVVDVDDSINAVKYLIKENLVDSEKTAIRGGSAGGYTTLCALAFRDFFKAGASYYGLSDLEVFVDDTHKFESQYLFSLIGPYPEEKALYKKRSAINHLDQIRAPMVIFQGLEDKIVPPNQAELMVEALRRNGLPVVYLPFEGEQHGFRMAKNIKRSLEVELLFYSKIFGFTPYEKIEPIEIENLP